MAPSKSPRIGDLGEGDRGDAPTQGVTPATRVEIKQDYY
jgi:hypothetical protein